MVLVIQEMEVRVELLVLGGEDLRNFNFSAIEYGKNTEEPTILCKFGVFESEFPR